MRTTVAMLGVLVLGACGDEKAAGGIIGCLDPVTSKYVACEGDTRCVDPSSGVEVQCAGGGNGSPYPGGGAGDVGGGDTGGPGSGGGPGTGSDVFVGGGALDTGLGGLDTGGPGGLDPDTGGTGGTGGAGTFTCEQVFACYDACQGDAACEKQCTDAGTPAALASFSLFSACSSGNGCATSLAQGHTGGYIACVYRHCLTEYQGCFGALTAGTKTCAQMVACMNACPAGDSACLKGCGETGTLDGQLLYFDILACAELKCPGLTGQAWADCVNATCSTELTACGQ